MRILMLGSKEYPFGVSAGHDPKAGGGIEAHVEKLSKYLARDGHEVFIVTRRFPGQAYRETLGNIRVYRTRYVPNRYLRAFSFNLLGFLLSIFLARRHRIDLIHAHAVTAGFFGSLLSILIRKPMVFTPHGTIVGWGFPVRQILRFMERASLHRARSVLFVSSMARDLLSPMVRGSSVLLSNAIDPEDYKRTPSKSRNPRFLFLGRLESVKGLDILIEAFSRLLKKHPGVTLTIAGEGSMKARVVDLILKAGSKNIRYAGWIDSSRALSESDVFVLPSREKGQPVALLEAMASGRIIITSLPYVKHNETGLRCKPDAGDLCSKMFMVCRHPLRYRKLGERARKESSSMGWGLKVKLFEEEYRKALSR